MTPSGIEPATFRLVAQCPHLSMFVHLSMLAHVHVKLAVSTLYNYDNIKNIQYKMLVNLKRKRQFGRTTLDGSVILILTPKLQVDTIWSELI